MSTNHLALALSLVAAWVYTAAAALLFAVALILGVQITPTAAGPVLTIPTATANLEPGDRILRAPIDSPTELHEARVARVSLEPAPAIWITRHYDNGDSVDFPVGGESFLKPLVSLPGWVDALPGKP
jgi:hypothetical protein